MAEKKYAVRLVAEGGQILKAELQGIGRDGKQAMEQLAVGQKSAAASAEVFTQAINAEAAGFQQLRASLDPVYASSKRYEAVQDQVNAAVRQGITTQSEANRVLELAQQRHLAVGVAADRAADTLEQEKVRLDQLRASLDPVYASSKRYEAVQDQVNASVRQGIATQTEANRILQMAEQRYLGATTALSPVGGAANRAAGGMKNMGQVAGQLSFQVQDFFVQMASGQSLFMAFAQQAPQAAGAFSMLGGRIGTVIPYVGTFIAIAAAVAPLMLNMGDKAKTAEDRVGDLQDALSKYQSAADAATMSTEDLREKYGELAEEARDALVSKMEEAAYDARKALSDAMKGIGADFTEEMDRLDSDAPGIRGLRERNQAALTLQDTFKLTLDDANRLRDGFDALDSAEGPVQTGKAADALRSLLVEAYGTMQDMPPAVAEIYSHLGDVVTTSGEMATQITISEEAARRLSGLDISSGISAAAAEALALASALGISLEKANAIAGVKPQSRFNFGLGAAPIEGVGNAGLSYGGEKVPNYRQVDPFVLPEPDSAIAPTTSTRPERRTLVAMDNFYAERDRAINIAGGGGGSGNDAERKAKQTRDEMLREAEATYEAQLNLRETYEKDVRRLDELLAAGAFDGFGGKDTYEKAFKDLKDGFKEASEEADKARGVFANTFSEITRGADSTGDVLMGLVDQWADKLLNDLGGNLYDSIFGDLLSGSGKGGKGGGGFLSDLLSSWGGGGGTGGGGSGSWWKNLFSFDGGGDTHSGPRVGGLDGKGGFLAVMHPHERVHDLTRGQGEAAFIGGSTFNIDARGAQRGVGEEIRGVIREEIRRAEPGTVRKSLDSTFKRIGKTKKGTGL